MPQQAMPTGHRGALHDAGALARRLAGGVGTALFLLAFLGFVVQVFYRYVLNQPLAWTQEFVMIAFLWAVFWSAAFTVPIRKHVTFDVVYDLVPPGRKRVFSIISMLAVIAAFLLLVPYTWDYLSFLSRRKSPVMRVPMNLVYGCFMLFILGFAIQACWRLARLFGRNWRDEI